MARIERLGKFEEVVMLTIVRLAGGAYGVAIWHEIKDQTGTEVSIGAVYTVLERLTRKGYISAKLGEPTRERGGRAKKFFKVEASGLQALTDTRDIVAKLTAGALYA